MNDRTDEIVWTDWKSQCNWPELIALAFLYTLGETLIKQHRRAVAIGCDIADRKGIIKLAPTYQSDFLVNGILYGAGNSNK